MYFLVPSMYFHSPSPHPRGTHKAAQKVRKKNSLLAQIRGRRLMSIFVALSTAFS
jgi:hypothetical protein